MQSLEARTQYRNAFHCAARIFAEEGVLRFWRGATPRLARLVLSGGIVFTVYEKGASLVLPCLPLFPSSTRRSGSLPWMRPTNSLVRARSHCPDWRPGSVEP